MPSKSGPCGSGIGRCTTLGTLADGSEVPFDTYQVTVLWEGQMREVFADEADTTPLVGMLLLDGCDLSIQVRNGGHVLIQENA